MFLARLIVRLYDYRLKLFELTHFDDHESLVIIPNNFQSSKDRIIRCTVHP